MSGPETMLLRNVMRRTIHRQEGRAMSRERELLKQAHDALERIRPQVRGALCQADVVDAVVALQAALAAPQGEPTAWMMVNRNHPTIGSSLQWTPPLDWHITWEAHPLYTTPQTAAPSAPAGWISCSERMPPRDWQVLVCHGNGQVWTDCWSGYREGEWDSQSDGGLGVVTHWMPLPEAPAKFDQNSPDHG